MFIQKICISLEPRCMRNTIGAPMTICFTVSAQTVVVGGEELKQNWPEME